MSSFYQQHVVKIACSVVEETVAPIFEVGSLDLLEAICFVEIVVVVETVDNDVLAYEDFVCPNYCCWMEKILDAFCCSEILLRLESF